jgi:hypothetical protein
MQLFFEKYITVSFSTGAKLRLIAINGVPVAVLKVRADKRY